MPAKISYWILLCYSEAGHWVCSFRASSERLRCRPLTDAACDWPWATCLGLSAIHLCLPLLGLGACGKEQTVHQGWLLPALGPEAGLQKSQSTRYLPLPGGCLLGLVIERASSCTPKQVLLRRVGQEGFLQVGLLLPLRLMLRGGDCSA